MIKMAIVGIGWWGKTLVEAVQGRSDALRFVAAASRSRSDEKQRFAAEYDLELCDSYADLLRNENVDAVLLATPPAVHRDQIVAAAAAGKHVFSEKPFTVTKAEALEVVEAARHAGITLGLGYNRRFHPSWQDLRERVRSGELGTVLHLASTMTGPNGLWMSADAWRASRALAPCGGLFPMAVHAIDGMIDLCGEFDEAYARSYRAAVPNDVDDTTTAVMHMTAGPTATITTMMATAASSRFEVFGSKGRAELLGTTHAAGQTSEQRRLGVFGSYLIQPVKGEPQHIEVPLFDSVAAELEAFAAACSGGPAFPISDAEMINGAATAEAIVRSAASGRPETV
ncbi:MAG: Gfo/Idh/MocA family oxidoreductase [Gammaproteobacteria bacterium]|jgi:predicted dehydrogenase